MTSAADLVQEMARRFQAGDADGARALFSPAIRILQPASLPHGGTHEGREGMDRMAALFGEHWAREISDFRLVDGGDSAVQQTTQTWTSHRTGRSATVEVVELFMEAHGTIAQIQVFPQDTHVLLATLD